MIGLSRSTICDGDRLLRTVPGGDQAGELHPGRGDLPVPALGAVAVHRAVEDDAGEPVLVGLEDRVDDGLVA